MEEVIRLLTHIDNMFCVCGVFLLFIVLCIFGYAVCSLIEEVQKQRKENKKDEIKTLKEEIVKEITSYYESTKENEK